MKEINLNDILIASDKTVKYAMKKLDVTASKILFVVDENRKYRGTLTDGDVRRHILKGLSLEDNVINACNQKSFIIREGYNKLDVYAELDRRGILHAPLLNSNNIIVDVISLPDAHSRINRERERLSLPVVIMAGGKGTRMVPFTTVLPKPLIPIGDKTLVEKIIDEFVVYGINKFYFTLNYRGEMIRAYFDGIEKAYNIEYVWEQNFNGTASSLSLIEGINSDFIVSNCDIIVKADFTKVYKFHKDNNAMLTVISSMQHHKFPYGVIDFKEGGEIVGLREKPEFTFPINTGVYILSQKCLDYIPKGEFFHMTHLIEKLISKGKKVVAYPINENDFMDTGQWDEYRMALSRLSI